MPPVAVAVMVVVVVMMMVAVVRGWVTVPTLIGRMQAVSITGSVIISVDVAVLFAAILTVKAIMPAGAAASAAAAADAAVPCGLWGDATFLVGEGGVVRASWRD